MVKYRYNSIVYSAGLRVGEVVNLKVSDIDSARMLVHVKQGKGQIYSSFSNSVR